MLKKSNMFERLIHSDLAINLCKFLDPKDIIMLIGMYPKIYSSKQAQNHNFRTLHSEKIYNKIEFAFKHRIGQKIDEFLRKIFGDQFDEFKENMIKCNGIISGSIILQMILQERWVSHNGDRLDVDIFVPVKPIPEDEKIYREYHKNNFHWLEIGERNTIEYTLYNFQKKFKLGYTPLHRFMYKNIDIHNHYNGYKTHSQYMDQLGENVILRVNSYVFDRDERVIFELIEINDIHKEDIAEYSDFDICKNSFTYNEDGSFTIYIKDLESIIDRRAVFDYL